MARHVWFAVPLLVFAVQSYAQTTLDPAAQIQAVAPQLTAFAGSTANFQNLANGLVQGAPVVLTSVTPDGSTQTVTLAPQAPMTPIEAARALEAARQLLIARGIANPTAQQLGVSLVGGFLPTSLGQFRTVGTVSGTVAPAALTLQQQAAVPFGGSSANFQSLTAGLMQGRPITLASSSTGAAPLPLTFTIPGAPLSAVETTQTLQLAGQLLASQGVTNPTPEQIRVALVGGTLNTGTSNVAVQGILQGRTLTPTSSSSVGTSASAARPTSTSATPGTSSSPQAGTSATAPNGPPSPAAQMQIRR